MKGYFSHLARSTGLRFEPYGNVAPRALASTPPVSESRPGREEVVPLHVESVNFTPSAEPPTASGRVAAAPDAIGLSHGEASNSSGAQDHSDHRRSAAQGHDAIVRRLNDPASLEGGDANPRSTFAESHVISPSEVWRTESVVEKQSPAAGQPATEFSEMSLNESAPPRSDRSVLSSPEVPNIRADATTSQEAGEGKHRSLTRQRPSFEFSESSFAQESDPMKSLERVAEFKIGLEGPADWRAQANSVNHEMELQVGHGVADSRSAEDQLDQEAIVRNYMKEVRAWVAESPAIEEGPAPISERDTGLELWAEASPKQRDVFNLEHEVVGPQIQDLSLSIGNISIVIEEPKKDAAAPAAAPPPIERSFERAASEPTRLSRYYLRPW